MEPKRVLVIDDREPELEQLVEALRDVLGDEATVDSWRPESVPDEDPLDTLRARVSSDTTLIVTDFDLTLSLRGFFGSSVVAWAKSNYFPVCNFSRRTPEKLPKVSDLFEFRLPANPDLASKEVARIFRGFVDLRRRMGQVADSSQLTSPSRVLGLVTGHEQAESEFSPYFSRVGSANGAIVERLQNAARHRDSEHDPLDRTRLLEYVVGHVLSNAILRYPGPIMDERVLCAYVGHSGAVAEELASYFASASYEGPFASGRRFYWRSAVDAVLELVDRPAGSDEFSPSDVQNRELIDVALAVSSDHHDCDRCGGSRGGFWCPFSERAVCERTDCSVASSSWIPDGAWLARAERDFYDEWAPMLGY